jgi:3-oxoadipate enol-lactonase
MMVPIGSFSFNVVYEGDKDKPLVILSHALMSNLHMWDSTVQALHKAGYSTIRYDHVGHGLTSPPSKEQIGRLHFDDFCRDISRILEAVAPGKTPFAIIGCSMGGVLAIRYATMYPGTLSKVVSCGAPSIDSSQASIPRWQERVETFQSRGVVALAEATVERWIPEPFPEGAREKALEMALTCSLEGYRTCADAMVNYSYSPELSKIQTEGVVVLIGDKDNSIGPKALSMELAASIKGARFVELRDCGHVAPIHRSEEFEKLLVDFLVN